MLIVVPVLAVVAVRVAVNNGGCVGCCVRVVANSLLYLLLPAVLYVLPVLPVLLSFSVVVVVAYVLL
jgi:hypothetical protein